MLTPTKKILEKADRKNYAVPAFNINNLEILQGVIRGAVNMRSPVIVQTSQGALEYAGMENLGVLVRQMAGKYPIPIAFHLDHGKDTDVVIRAIKSGYYTSVMYDGSHLPYKHNVVNTKKLVKLAHRYGISLEAELGSIPGKEDNVDVSVRDAFYTDPVMAQDFVQKTDCDFLAVSIGTAHGPNKFTDRSYLDFPRLREIESRVRRPLVLHGASGIPKNLLSMFKKYSNVLHDENRLANARGVSSAHIKKAIAMGIDKINIDSDLRIAFLVAVREVLIRDHHVFDPRKILAPARDLIA